jgi:O-antigen/teichoic acid export membrane protein
VQPPSSAPPPTPLTAAVLRGVTWNTIGLAVQTLCGLAAGILIARFLGARDFAVAGIAITVAMLLNVALTNTFGQLIVQREEITPELCHSIFWFLTACGLILAATVAAIAGPIARFYHDPAVAAPLRAAAAVVAINAIAQVPLALLQRTMCFRALNLVRVIASISSAIIAIVLAVRGAGYWALVFQQLTVEVAAAAGALLFAGYRPAPTWSWTEIRSAFRFSGAIALYSATYTFGARADYLIMARFWTPAQSGLYYFAYDRSRQILNVMAAQVSGTLLPALSRMQNELERLRDAFLHSTRSWCVVFFPLHVLMIGLADPLLPWIFGAQWRPAILLFQIFALYTLAGAPWSMASDTLTAVGKPEGNLYFAIIRMAVSLAVLVVLGITRASIHATALTLLVAWIFIIPLWSILLRRAAHIAPGHLWIAVRRPVLAALAMAAVLATARAAAAILGLPAWLDVTVGAVLSILTYAAITRSDLQLLASQLLHAIRSKELVS